MENFHNPASTEITVKVLGMASTRVTKAVIPAAGLGTRFLPATKAVPKELLPVVDKPALEYIVEEAARVGLDDILMISARSKSAIEDHFDRVPEIEAALEKKGDDERLRRGKRPHRGAQSPLRAAGRRQGAGPRGARRGRARRQRAVRGPARRRRRGPA